MDNIKSYIILVVALVTLSSNIMQASSVLVAGTQKSLFSTAAH